MTITVLTPTYNRAKLLNRLYLSLCQQTYQDFEWILVNDGSKDNTDDVAKDFISENKIHIHYIRQENNGKHRAVNRGVKEAKGELIFIADSDDWLPNNSLEIINQEYLSIRHLKNIAGIAGFDAFPNGEKVGSGNVFDVLECTPVELWCKHKIHGDMKEVIKTSVMKEFPFPEIEGEKFCPEELLLIRISNKYKLKYINKVIYFADYQPDGLSAKIVQIRMQSPISAMIDCYEYNHANGVPIQRKIKNAINYWRWRWFIQKENINNKKIALKYISFFNWWWASPLGWIAYKIDKTKHER